MQCIYHTQTDVLIMQYPYQLDQLEEHVTYLVCEVELNKKKIAHR